MFMNLHDFLSLLLIIYWFHLVLHLNRMDRPLIPFMVFFLHTVVEPYLLLGERGATFIRVGRFMNFYLSYPMALSVLTMWLLEWVFRNRSALFARSRQGGDN